MNMTVQVFIDYEALEQKIQEAVGTMSVPVSVHLMTKREIWERKESRASRVRPKDRDPNSPEETTPRHEFTKPMRVK